AVPAAGGHLSSGLGDRLAHLRIDVAERLIHAGRGLLHDPERLDHPAAEALAAYREVLDRPLGLSAIESGGGNPHLPHRILFYSEIFGHVLGSSPCRREGRSLSWASTSGPRF